MSIVIRAAAETDRAFLSALAERLADFDAPPAWRTREEIAAGDRRDLLSALDAPPEGSALVVAELNARPAGCVHVLTKTDFFTGLPHGHLSVIAVARDAEGRGVGRALMTWVDRWAADQGLTHVTLHVFPANARARALYERHGYAVDMLTLRRDLRRTPRVG
jgi:ribosomal protein S18 acetylase RimI-like enzyme